MTIHMTEQQARAAGLLKGKQSKRSTAGSGRDGALSRCHACGEEFTSDTKETKHMNDTGHARYISDMR